MLKPYTQTADRHLDAVYSLPNDKETRMVSMKIHPGKKLRVDINENVFQELSFT